MKVFTKSKYGGAEVLLLEEVEKPAKRTITYLLKS